MIVSLFLKEHKYLIDKPQTLNFGGKYLYSFLSLDEHLIVRRTLNENYIADFYNISESECKIDLLSAIVGQNGVGKSTVLDTIRKVFIQHEYSMPHSLSTVLVEIDGETKVLFSRDKVFMILDENEHENEASIRKDFRIKYILHTEEGNTIDGYEELEYIETQDYQSIYYSPHFDLKYNVNFDEVDEYDISLDQFIKRDLEDTDKKGPNENGWKFDLHEELVFKNSMRQIEFLESNIFKYNLVFDEIFNLPQYEKGILYFRDVELTEFWNTPMPLRPILELILERIEEESKNWHIFRDSNASLDDNLLQALVNKYLLERFVIKAFISVIINQMEKRNTWLQEGNIEKAYDIDRFKNTPAKEILFYFIEESYIESSGQKDKIFNYEEIFLFFEKLDSLFIKETNPNNITQQSIKLSLSETKEVLLLHKKIIINLLHYYPTTEGLVQKGDYTDGFISFRPTDKNMSSGESALLSFFSKLYNFIQNNLTEQSKSLPDRANYILLLDEADLGFHPIWKKRYVNAILRTIPQFFETLQTIPNLQIIITTHDALTLSDFPINNVVFLQKDGEYCSVISNNDENKIQKTFGANITHLLAHSFFVENGLIGDFSKSKIKEVINWINESKSLSDVGKSSNEFVAKLRYYKKVVNLIDEKVIKLKLIEMITDLVPDDTYHNLMIDKEIEFLKSRKR